MNYQERARQVVSTYCKKTGFLALGSKQAQILETLVAEALEDAAYNAVHGNNRPPKQSALAEFERKFSHYLEGDDD